MSRPTVPRRIPLDLMGEVFKPQGFALADLETVELTLDGLESLRLADLEGLYQEEAAQRMGVSRATFARIVSESRRAVAEADVLNVLRIQLEDCGASPDRGTGIPLG